MVIVRQPFLMKCATPYVPPAGIALRSPIKEHAAFLAAPATWEMLRLRQVHFSHGQGRVEMFKAGGPLRYCLTADAWRVQSHV